MAESVRSRNRRWPAPVAALALALSALVPAGGLAAGAPPDEPTRLGEKVSATVAAEVAANGTTDFWVRFGDQPDLTAYAGMRDWGGRGQAVYDALVATARDSQAEVVASLDEAGVDYRAFHVTNAIFVSGGDAALLGELAADVDVEQVLPDVAVELPTPTPAPPVGPSAVGWNIADINADDLWAQGIRGEGIVVGVLDTGVDFRHPALVDHYRGSNGDGTFTHAYNWFDSDGDSPLEPADRQSHGTHVTGIVVGDDGGTNQIGVAPGARWVAANGCCPSQADLVASAEWMLAPTDLDGANPRPDLRPHVINNSWSTTVPSTSPFLEDISRAWAAAGQFAVFAVGNNGPGCGTAGSPGSRIINYAVGAYDPTHAITTVSGRGGGQAGSTKPDLAAPGQSIRSSVPGGANYVSQGGTSMATPHVTGSVALLWSAAPHLVGAVGPTRVLLDRTAIDTEDLRCGGTAADNNVFGQGRLDAAALIAAAPGPGEQTSVERAEGADRYATAAQISAAVAPGATVVYVASGLAFPDALAGAARAGSEDGPVLLTRRASLPAVTAAELTRLAPQRVVVLGGEGAVSDHVLAQVAAASGAASVERVGGADRYETAALLAQGSGAETVFVASGQVFPDALAGAARAAHLDAPVLLVRPGGIPPVTAARLADLAPGQIVLLGGTAAVSAAVEQQLEDVAPVARVAGADRYGTAAALSGQLPSATGAWIASGSAWPDALAAAARAGADGHPLLLTRNESVPVPTWDELGRLGPATIHLAGGPAAISLRVADDLVLLP